MADQKTDCVSFKPNSTNMLIQNMWCNGSHGISVGSLGQYVGAYDIVENIYVFNTSLHNATVSPSCMNLAESVLIKPGWCPNQSLAKLSHCTQR